MRGKLTETHLNVVFTTAYFIFSTSNRIFAIRTRDFSLENAPREPRRVRGPKLGWRECCTSVGWSQTGTPDRLAVRLIQRVMLLTWCPRLSRFWNRFSLERRGWARWDLVHVAIVQMSPVHFLGIGRFWVLRNWHGSDCPCHVFALSFRCEGDADARGVS